MHTDTQDLFDLAMSEGARPLMDAVMKHIQDNVLNTNKAVRQYVNDTLFRTGTKNFYDSFTMMNNIVAYCQENNIETTADFQNIYTQLKNLH